jgi:hypothetical protein
MYRKMILAVLLISTMALPAAALEIGGVFLPETLKAGNEQLILNGAGLRKKFGFKVYAAGLYLMEKTSDAKAVLDADKLMSLKMQWRRGVSPQKINDVFFESFAEAIGAPEADEYGPKNNYGPLTKEIVLFMSWVSREETTPDHTWTYIYTPGKGTDIYLSNGKEEKLMGTIKGLEFKKALFSIWIKEDPPVGVKLKKNLMGLEADFLDF